ncbi:tetratricopeptide repeat protein [Ramlibacter sp. USB13]|uniref:protein O-GlcNAc transferase n=1 Tax=Ramlibacter cellulosilyticus TaxID=2764187 RepID=A0A923MPE6_9BURK|nr:tetratricopeptide repeat protein [Ramlibacter cellulosilyticus]MBC5782775.1 tetratricopeptide repeat protein [Ramlibacter cellulosilyticus]
MFKNLLKSIQGSAPAPAPTPAPAQAPAPAAAGAHVEAQALIAQGNAAEDAGQLAQARGLYERAVALAPALPSAHLNLGIALEALGDAEAARARYVQVLALEPGHPFGAYNLGKLEFTQGRLREAETLLRRAIAGKGDFHQAWVLLSNVLDALGNLQGAADAIAQALRLQPDYAGALFNQASLLRRLGRMDECEAAAARAAALDPDNADYLSAHSAALVTQGFAAEALAQLQRAIALAPARFDLRSKELFLLNLVEGVSVEEVWERHRQLGAQLESVVKARTHGTPDAARQRLRLGFVSGEMRTHPVALFLLPVLERLDRRRYEVTCYASNAQKDAITQRLQSLSGHWVDAAGWKDDRLEQRMVADGIDILVDLDGHTSQVRLAVFATKPAPVQVAWIGYLNTTGLTRMDFRLTDARCDPPAVSQAMHTERLLYLPHSQWCFRPFLEVPLAPAAPCERNGFVTFGSLNNVVKLTEPMARRWGRILQALPDARLVVAGIASEKKRDALLRAIVEGGGSAERVRFAPRTDLEGYYRLMDDIDIALDSYPYGGGTTTFDALWMGVPVLAVSGPLPASRSAASILQALALDAWIAPEIAAYEEQAIARARDVAALADLRRTLRERLRRSPLMDEPAFVAAFQDALERAWRERAAAGAAA